MMSNKILIILVGVALILSLVGIYLGQSVSKTPQQLEGKVESLRGKTGKQGREIQLLREKVPPYIYAGQGVGYVIEFENGAKFYFAGATGLTADLELIGDYYKPDVAFLPIGNIYTTGPKNAAYAANLIRPSKFIVPSRYGSFPELEENPAQFFQALKRYNLRATPLEFEVGKKQKIMGVSCEWLGHGHWLLEGPEGVRILVDPQVKNNPDFPEKYKELVQLEKIDLVLITNGHFETMSVSDLRKWGQLFDPVFMCPYELGVWLKGKLPGLKILALNQGSRITEKELVKLGVSKKKAERLSKIIVNVTSANHSSSANP